MSIVRIAAAGRSTAGAGAGGSGWASGGSVGGGAATGGAAGVSAGGGAVTAGWIRVGSQRRYVPQFDAEVDVLVLGSALRAGGHQLGSAEGFGGSCAGGLFAAFTLSL